MRTLRSVLLLSVAAAAAACSSRPAPTPDRPARVEAARPSPQPAPAYTPPSRPAPSPSATQQPAAPTSRPVASAPQAPAQARPPAPAPQPAAADVETWRPAWWVDGVKQRDGRTVAGAMATEADLLAARRRAVDAAGAALERALGKSPADTDTKADTLRLPDGRYRAFIIVSAPTN